MSSSLNSSSEGARGMPVSIQPLDLSDVSTCASISAAAFAVDPHTIIKQLGQQPYDMFAMTRSGLEENLPKREKFVCMKAVDNRGIIVGHASWVFSGGGQKRASQARGDKAEEDDPIERLHALEEADMQYWLQNLVPVDTPCMFVIGLVVSPGHQGQGIGSALLRYGNAIADERRLSTWVHSSHQAYAAYCKAGFETRRELKIDLDAYALRPPREGEATMADSNQWGQYVIRYMERKPGDN
ncbi:hypothetical protein F5Y10DRAFT_23371 [Nemania abortiva]|nr:hypothetical protein F5Y10DRAFT_23371 [Nemania abortiva]